MIPEYIWHFFVKKSLEFIRHLIDLDGKFFLNETTLLLLGLIEEIRLHLFINLIETCQIEK